MVSLYVHDDLIITKGGFRPEWIVGETTLILLVLWSLFVMLSPLNSKLFGILSLLWAFGISILAVCGGIMMINEGVETYGGLRGLLLTLFFTLTLCVFPSLGVLIIPHIQSHFERG